MTQTKKLKSDQPLVWSPGTGLQVWEMFRAAIAGDIDSIRTLLKKDPSLARCQFCYRTPLYFAVRENQLDVTACLLDHVTDPIGLAVNDTLMEITRDRGYAQMQNLLETKLAERFNISSQGQPIAAAVREGNLEKVQSILNASPKLLHVGDTRGNQPIHWAVMTRQLHMIDELLQRGADINAKRSDGATPIQLVNGDYIFRGWRDVPKDHPTTPQAILAHLRAKGAYCDINTAAHIGDIDRVKELLDQDATLANRAADYVTYYAGSGTPLRNAAAKGNIEIVKLLLDHGADPNLPEEGIAPLGHALYSAVAGKYFEIAKLLLERGANPSAAVESSADCLSRAINHDDKQMIELLASYGAARSMEIMAYYGDVLTAAAALAANPALADDIDALANAADNGHDGFVRLLLRYQPDLPKQAAFGAKTRELSEMLFQHGMNPSHPNWLGITPLHEFARRGDAEKATIFIEHGADLHARDEDICSTPLAWAAKFNKPEMVELFLKHGAKTNLPDDPPWATPLAWATRRGHDAVASLLKQHGAS